MVARGLEPGATDPGGVSLELFAALRRALMTTDADLATLLARHGVATEDWARAAEGWAEQIRNDFAVARRFNHLYTSLPPS